jgi:2-hydroxychromene-2-carboxylate isomerase
MTPRDLPVLDFWFDFGSNYSYLSMMRIESEAARHGIGIRWQPFLLGPIFRSFGWSSSPFVLQKEKGDYTWKDMARQCRRHACRGSSPRSSRGPPCCRFASRSSARHSPGWASSAGARWP